MSYVIFFDGDVEILFPGFVSDQQHRLPLARRTRHIPCLSTMTSVLCALLPKLEPRILRIVLIRRHWPLLWPLQLQRPLLCMLSIGFMILITSDLDVGVTQTRIHPGLLAIVERSDGVR